MWLVVIFVVLPFVVAPIVIALVARRAPSVPAAHRTGALLADGEPGRGTVLGKRSHATSFVDFRPMGSLRLEVTPDAGGPPFELTVTQPIPRAVFTGLEEGMVLPVRFSPDRKAGAVILPQ